MGDYRTVRQAADHLNLSPSTVRRRIEAGEFPGALRISGTTGAWRIPAAALNDSTPPACEGGRGVSAAASDRRTRDDLMSSHAPHGVTAVHTGQRVVEALHSVTTRPSRAAAVMVAPLAAIVARHYPNRDGWCAACSWQHPCTDYLTASDALDHAARIVLDGAA